MMWNTVFVNAQLYINSHFSVVLCLFQNLTITFIVYKIPGMIGLFLEITAIEN